MPRTAPRPQAPRQLTKARNSVYIVFAATGFAFASWVARIPGIRDTLELSPGQLGRLLLALAVGACIALPTSGYIVSRIGAARTVAAGVLVAGTGLIVAGLGTGPANNAAVVAVGLFLLGYGTGAWDVAMNVEGAAVEQLLKRNIMPRFHAVFSLGTVLGAGTSAGLTWLDVPVHLHLSTVGALVIVVVTARTRHFLPRRSEADDAPGSLVSVLAAWREPRTLLVGVMVLSFALVEGIANDWLAVGLVDGYDVPNAVGSAGFAFFVAIMTLGRTAGPWLLHRYGRLRVLRLSGLVTVVGVVMVALSSALPVAAAGVLLWGFGAALGFPVGMSAAADDPRRAAARVSVVSSIAYTSFLAGPPLLGWIGDHQGIVHALLVAAVAGALGALVATSARKETRQEAPVS